MVSARPSDIRDLATLLWKNGVPEGLDKRVTELGPYPEIFAENIKTKLIPNTTHPSFLDSWKGTFVTKEFSENARQKVMQEANAMLNYLLMTQKEGHQT